jgi:hypothetical protein
MSPHPDLYSLPILRWIAYHRMGTLHQVLHVFWTAAGRNPSAGYAVIRRLVERELLTTEPLDPHLQARSLRVLRVTRQGWRFLGVEPTASMIHVDPRLREYRLQFAEMMIHRELEGWRLVTPTRSWEVLREWLVRPYRGRMLNSEEQAVRRSIERLPAQALPSTLLQNPSSGDIRLILPIRRGRSYKRILHRVPVVATERLAFEVVCADLSLLTSAERVAKRWAARRKLTLELHRVRHFRQRSNPRADQDERADMYSAAGVADPRERW